MAPCFGDLQAHTSLLYACAVLGEPQSCKYLPFAQSRPAAGAAADRQAGARMGWRRGGGGSRCALWERGLGEGQRGEADKQTQAPGDPSGTHILLPCNRQPEWQRYGPGASPVGEKVPSAIKGNLGSLWLTVSPQGIRDNTCRHFWWSHLEVGGATGIQWVETKDAP